MRRMLRQNKKKIKTDKQTFILNIFPWTKKKTNEKNSTAVILLFKSCEYSDVRHHIQMWWNNLSFVAKMEKGVRKPSNAGGKTWRYFQNLFIIIIVIFFSSARSTQKMFHHLCQCLCLVGWQPPSSRLAIIGKDISFVLRGSCDETRRSIKVHICLVRMHDYCYNTVSHIALVAINRNGIMCIPWHTFIIHHCYPASCVSTV